MRLPFALSLLLLVASVVPVRVAAAPKPSPSPAPGLAFALALKGNGEVLASGPFSLKVPGGNGPLRLEIARLSVEGARLRGEALARNASDLLLAGVALDFTSATPVRRDAPEQGAASTVFVRLREPLAFGDLLPGEATPWIPFELSPVPLGADIALTTVLGAVSGLAAEAPFSLEGAGRPVALDADRSGRLYVACGGTGRVLRFAPPWTATPAEVARPSSPPAGVALRRRNGDLFVSTGGRVTEVYRPGRGRPDSLDAERSVTTLRTDGKGALRAASGNGVLAFDEAKPGPLKALGPEGSSVVSFDTDASGLIYAVVREGNVRRLVVGKPAGPEPFGSRKGTGADALDDPSACRFDGEGTLWVAAIPRAPESTVVARLSADGAPLASLSRLALGLLLGKDEEAAIPAVVDLAPGPERRLYALLEDGAVFALRPF